MQEKQKEVRDLKKLLATTRLTPLDRKAIQARIEELSPTPRSEERTRPESPYFLGVFDRPKPSSIAEPASSPPQPQLCAAIQSGVPSQPPGEEPEIIALTPAPSLAPEELERLGHQLLEIAERIALLRRVWASTLAFEVDREAESWLARLQQIAANMPREAAERALGEHRGYLGEPVRTVTRPQIPEKTQERLLPPSAPSAKGSELRSELYWMMVAPPRPEPEPIRPPGYVPDGLQSWVS